MSSSALHLPKSRESSRPSSRESSRSCGTDTFDEMVGRCMAGCREAQSELADHVHRDFYRIAKRLCMGKGFAHSMHATNLLNETFLRLIKSGVFQNPKSSGYLFTSAGKTMRDVIADYLRRKNACKRIPAQKSVFLDKVFSQLAESPRDFDDLDEALDRLEIEAPRWAEVVNMRFFFGMTLEEISQSLDVSKSTVESDWRKARVWLFRYLQ